MPIPMPLGKLPDFLLHRQPDLSDISEFKDYMVTSSNEDIPTLEDMLILKETLV